MSQHNEIIERSLDRALASAFIRMAQMAKNREGGESVQAAFIFFLYEEVLAAFKDGVNAKADAMMAQQSEAEWGTEYAMMAASEVEGGSE